jgi:hypothetical protein
VIRLRVNARDKGKGRAVEKVEVIDNVSASKLGLIGNQCKKCKTVDTDAVASSSEPRKLPKHA